jgi:hypothetical protein
MLAGLTISVAPGVVVGIGVGVFARDGVRPWMRAD